MTDTLVAINILNETDNTLLNTQKYPILYYWDGNGDLFETLKNDDNFKRYVLDNITQYFNARMYFFFFDDREGNETYIEQNKSLQECVTFDELNDTQKRVLIHEYVFPCFDKLYQDVFKTPYPNSNIENVYDIIKSIHAKVKNKYGDRVSTETITNYIRSELMKNKSYDFIIEDTRKSLFKLITEIING